MGRLPPVEKLSLVVRKNVRDEWDSNKASIEGQLSELLGVPWTVEANPNAIWPYHNDGYAKESLGSCIKSYVEGAIYQIKYLAGRYGDELKTEINDLCPAHILTLELEETTPPRFSYGGCDVSADGKLRVLFVDGSLGTNIDYACQEESLFKALNTAPTAAAVGKPLSFVARNGIRNDYDAQIGATRAEIAELLGKTADAVTLTPGFEAAFAALEAAAAKKGSDVRDDWQQNLGGFAAKYFAALAYQMKYLKVGEDELVQEGFLEAVSTNEVAFRIVEKLKYDSYCEVDIEDGVLYLQTTAERWGSNIDYVASQLMDRL
ncbi:hypothetical protein B0T24DRAFT_602357 [Lasiosphaeria ovina]|uniref:Uncharacterized protein n=1 Tax=Lasiosphaeria ovina TaxID=92902 RepID=A0AAE0NJL1_9PEZI|nr:hypothetical protein B0T24DRAFT_602357 [Lasiosphaeria ovina]